MNRRQAEMRVGVTLWVMATALFLVVLSFMLSLQRAAASDPGPIRTRIQVTGEPR